MRGKQKVSFFFWISCLFVFPFQEAVSRGSPTSDYIAHYGWEEISFSLKQMGIPPQKQLLPCYEIFEKQKGFLGYHGTCQSYRIYQDIVRALFKEILKVPIRKDFHFLRIPGDEEFLFSSNRLPDHYQSKTCFCFNFSLYGNHYDRTSCSYRYFYSNSSSSYINYKKELIPFFLSLGMDQKKIGDLFSIGEKYLETRTGVLYILMDPSYLSGAKNPYYKIYEGWQEGVAEMILNGGVSRAKNFGVLLLNHEYALNPYATFSLFRYDRTPAPKKNQYKKELREQIRAFEYDPQKVEKYKKRVFQLWGVTHER